MKDALYYIVTAIVDDPESVVIEEQEDSGVVTFSIKVADSDIGKVIGKEGKVIKAIRNVLKIPAIKQGKKLYISLVEKPQQ